MDQVGNEADDIVADRGDRQAFDPLLQAQLQPGARGSSRPAVHGSVVRDRPRCGCAEGWRRGQGDRICLSAGPRRQGRSASPAPCAAADRNSSACSPRAAPRGSRRACSGRSRNRPWSRRSDRRSPLPTASMSLASWVSDSSSARFSARSGLRPILVVASCRLAPRRGRGPAAACALRAGPAAPGCDRSPARSCGSPSARPRDGRGRGRRGGCGSCRRLWRRKSVAAMARPSRNVDTAVVPGSSPSSRASISPCSSIRSRRHGDDQRAGLVEGSAEEDR